MSEPDPPKREKVSPACLWSSISSLLVANACLLAQLSSSQMEIWAAEFISLCLIRISSLCVCLCAYFGSGLLALKLLADSTSTLRAKM